MHDDFLTVLMNSSALSPKARREALLPLATNAELACAVRLLLPGNDLACRRAAARALADLATDAGCRRHLLHQLELHPQLPQTVLADGDAKLRKNFAELLGRLDADAYAGLLIDAYQAEPIEYVKPSILLALGNARGSEQACAFLQTVQPAREGEQKHITQQLQALHKAQDSLQPRRFTPLPAAPMAKPRDLILLCPNARITAEELQSLGMDAKAYDARSGLCLAHNVRQFAEIYQARSFYEAGVLLYESDSLRHAAGGLTRALVERNVRNLYGRTDLAYRMDVTGPTITQKERSAVYAAVNAALAGSSLHNSPSAYDFELRISCLGKRFIACLFPGSQNDTRFAWRKQAIPASMHPAVAAACCRVIAGYGGRESDVLDCFCGAGTFLLERAQLPCRSLSGSDISPAAVKIARANAASAGIRADWFVKNAVTPFDHTYDEVIGNLPFGLRVSNHAANEALYAAFLENLRRLLRPGGRAFLFTNEKKLMQSLLGAHFLLESKVNFAAGGLYPTLYVLRPLA